MALNDYRHIAKPPAPGAPLVFAFHGTGGDERQFVDLVADILPDAGIVSPRGDVDEGGANRFFRRTGEGVYDMEDLAVRTKRMAGFVGSHRAAHEGSPGYALGYSNGANILASVAMDLPALFDRIVLMHPLIPWDPEPSPGLAAVEILITAGRRDPICPLARTEALMAYLREQGATVTLHLHDGGHEVRQDEVAAVAAFIRDGPSTTNP